MIGVAVDVTARLEAEEALRQTEQQLRTLIEHAPVGACIVDEHDTFVTINAAYCALFGYTREELVGHPTALVTARTAHPEQATRLIAEGVRQGHAQGDVEVVTKGGRPVTVLTTSIPLSARLGQLGANGEETGGPVDIVQAEMDNLLPAERTLIGEQHKTQVSP